MQSFPEAAFLRAAASAADLPPAGPPEAAFAGRSNVGKSSAINALLGRRALARTSKTPGRTQTINFYSVGEARLADLPGYGYAKVSRELRAQWAALVGAYLRSDRPLAGVIVVMDARHPLTPLDRQLLGWLAGRPVHVLLSKADKLSRDAQARTLRAARAELGDAAVTLFSSVTRQGVEEGRTLLGAWLGASLQAGGENKKPPVKGK